MKIVVIRHSIRNRGGDRLVLEYLSYLVRNGHEVIYWTNEIDTDFKIDQSIQIKRIPCLGTVGTIIFTLFSRFKAADIVLVDLVVMSVFAGFLNRRKVVYLAQDYDVTYYSSLFLRKIIEGFYVVSLSMMNIFVVSVSAYLADKLSRYTRHRIAVVPNGIDLNIFYCDKQALFLNEKKAPTVIVLYARGDYRKGLDVGIKAIEELNRRRGCKDWELWTIGDDAVQINVEGLRIKRWGFLNDADLRGVLSAADIYLSPSRHEGFGLMQLEAMACGSLMVTSNAFTLVTHEVNALVSSVEDWKALAENLDRAIRDKELADGYKSAGRELVMNFNIKESCVLFEKELVLLVSKKGR